MDACTEKSLLVFELQLHCSKRMMGFPMNSVLLKAKRLLIFDIFDFRKIIEEQNPTTPLCLEENILSFKPETQKKFLNKQVITERNQRF